MLKLFMLEIIKFVLTLSLLIVGGITIVMTKGFAMSLIGIIMFVAGLLAILMWL